MVGRFKMRTNRRRTEIVNLLIVPILIKINMNLENP